MDLVSALQDGCGSSEYLEKLDGIFDPRFRVTVLLRNLDGERCNINARMLAACRREYG